MPPQIAVWITWFAVIYAFLGLVFAIPFVIYGAAKIDPAARNTSWVFRVLLVAGSIPLWPWLLRRWLRGRRPRRRDPRNAEVEGRR